MGVFTRWVPTVVPVRVKVIRHLQQCGRILRDLLSLRVERNPFKFSFWITAELFNHAVERQRDQSVVAINSDAAIVIQYRPAWELHWKLHVASEK